MASPTPIDAEFVAKARAAQKACQRGVGGRDALEQAHAIMADCYGVIGRLLAYHDANPLAQHPRTVQVHLSHEEYTALYEFKAEHRSGALDLPVCARLLIRDQLIHMGLLDLPDTNRAKGAKRK